MPDTMKELQVPADIGTPSLWVGLRLGAKKGGIAFLVCSRVLLDDDLDAAVLRLAHAVAGLHEQALLAAANDRDRLRRHALTHQGVLHRVRATQRQCHVVGLRAGRVGVAGRRDSSIAPVLKASAACLIVFKACWLKFERSQSKNTMNDGGATIGGGGGGAAMVGWPNL